MADPTVTDLIEVLQERAEVTVVPTVPIESLLSRGRESRRARTRASVAVAALVAAVTIGVVVVAVRGQSPEPTPRPIQPPSTTAPATATPSATATDTASLPGNLPEGPRPKIAYWTGQSVFYGDQGIDLESSIGGVLQGPRSVFVTTSDLRIVEYRPDTSSRVVTTSGSQPVIDAAGHYLAWQKHTTGQAVVVVRRLDGSEADRVQTFPFPASCSCDNPFALFGITDDGRVIAGMDGVDRVWIWDFAHPTPARQVTGLPRNAGERQVVGDRLVLKLDARYAIGGISAAGRWEESPPRNAAAGRPSFADNALWSPSAAKVAYLSHNQLMVFDENDGVNHPMDVPITGVYGERFEDERHLLVVLAASRKDSVHQLIVRCDVVVGRCEQAAAAEGDLQLAD